MMKRLVILIALLGLLVQTSGCTSKETQAESPDSAEVTSSDLEELEEGAVDEAETTAAAESLGEESAEIENLENTEGSEAASDEEGGTSETAVAQAETLPPDPFAEGATQGKNSEVTSEPSPPMAENTTPAVEPLDTVADTAKPEESRPQEIASNTSSINEEEAKPKASSAPLQKVATVPWKVGNTLFNSVYFARPGDNLLKISKMIYGKDMRKQLRKGNPVFQSRDVRPGDKVYYNSPTRPEDASRISTYYEDNGITPEVYIAKPGDNIRKISKNLLGYDGAWKEVWSSNAVESKAEIPEGTELRYWKAGLIAAAPAPESEAPKKAKKSKKKEPMPAQEPMAEVAKNEPQIPPAPEVAPPPPMEQPQASIPPPPPVEQQQAAVEVPPPPPPAPEQQAAADIPPPPPPPPPEMIEKNMQAGAQDATPVDEDQEEAEAGSGVGQDTTMALGIVGLAAAVLAVLIVLRKKRKMKELEAQTMDTTQLGS